MQDHLNLIESVLTDVGGYLEYLLSRGLLHPRHVMRAEQHEENIGEALRALMEVKQKVGLPAELAEEAA